MNVPAQFAKQQDSRTACIDQLSGVEVSAQDAPPNHREHLSAEKTTVALVALFDRPVAAWAATVLWDENRETIEREMARSLHPSSDAASANVCSPGWFRKPGFFAWKWMSPKPGSPAAPTWSPGAWRSR
jgi:hypothetical protein